MRGSAKEQICVYSIVTIAVLQMLSMFKIFDFKPLIALLGVFVVVVAYEVLSPSFKRMAVIFISLGFAVNIYSGQSLSSWIAGVNYMLSVSSILVVMQIFTISIKLGDYAGSMEYLLLRSFNTERGVYFFSMCITHIFASILLFGTIPVMVTLLGGPLQKIVRNYQRFASTALTRSYSMVVLWAPGAVNILLVINTTGAKWSDIFLPGVLIGVMGILLAYFFELPHLSKQPLACIHEQVSDKSQTAAKAVKKIVYVVIIVVIFVFFAMFFEALGIGDTTSRITLVGLIVSLSWLACFAKHPDFKKGLRDYVDVSLVKTIDLAVLFIALGVFSKALDDSGMLAYFNPYISALANYSGSFMLAIIPGLVFACAIVGLHPFVVMVLLAKIMMGLELPFSVAILSVAIIFGSSIAYIASPFAGIVLATSKFVGVSAYQVGFRWNGLYGVLYFIMGSLLLILWDKLEHLLK